MTVLIIGTLLLVGIAVPLFYTWRLQRENFRQYHGKLRADWKRYSRDHSPTFLPCTFIPCNTCDGAIEVWLQWSEIQNNPKWWDIQCQDCRTRQQRNKP